MTEQTDFKSELKLPAERPPFAGFLARLLAFLIDGVLLYFVFKGLDRGARPALLALNPWLPWLGHLLIFLYFLIGYGPLTRGQTAGKALASLRVVGGDGQPIGWSAAAKRALLQQGVFAIFLWIQKPMYELVFPVRLDVAVGLGLSIAGIVALTYAFALTLTVVFHPWKRGWHDLWAESYVTSTPTPQSFWNTLQAEPDVVIQRKLANFVKMSLIFWGAATVAILISSVRSLTNAEQRRKDTQLAQLKADVQWPDHRLAQAVFPDNFTRSNAMKAIASERELRKTRNEAVPTTESLVSQLETIVAVTVRSHGAVSPDEWKSPDTRAAVEDLRHRMWQEWQTRAASRSTTDTLAARRFEALLFEPFALVMYNGTQHKGRAHGAADPAQGKLTFEDVSSFAPQAADSTTTATASPEAPRPHATPGS